MSMDSSPLVGNHRHLLNTRRPSPLSVYIRGFLRVSFQNGHKKFCAKVTCSIFGILQQKRQKINNFQIKRTFSSKDE